MIFITTFFKNNYSAWLIFLMSFSVIHFHMWFFFFTPMIHFHMGFSLQLYFLFFHVIFIHTVNVYTWFVHVHFLSYFHIRFIFTVIFFKTTFGTHDSYNSAWTALGLGMTKLNYSVYAPETAIITLSSVQR